MQNVFLNEPQIDFIYRAISSYGIYLGEEFTAILEDTESILVELAYQESEANIH